MAVPAGLIVGWPSTAGSIPAGWDQVVALNDRYLKGVPTSATNPGTTGGSATHSHTTPGHTHPTDHSHTTSSSVGAASGSVNREAFAPIGTVEAEIGHTHSRPTTNSASVNSGSASPGTVSESNDPSNLSVIWIESDGTPDGIPDGALAFYDNTSLPVDWSLFSDSAGRFCKGHATAGGAVSAGNLTHGHSINSHTHGGTSHSHTSPNTGAASAGDPAVASGASSGVALTVHTHPVTVASAASASLTSAGGGTSGSTGAPEPPYRVEGVIANGAGQESLPARIIVAWLGLLSNIPANWVLCDGTNGTPDLRGKYIKGAASTAEIGGVGGSVNTHTHAGGSHTHGTSGHSHTSSAGSGTDNSANKSPDSPTTARTSTTHTHSVSSTNSTTPSVDSTGAGTLAASGTEPPYTEVAFLQYQGAAFTGDVIDAVVSSGGTSASLPELANSAGLLLVAISFDRGSTSDATFTATDASLQAAVSKVLQHNTLPGDVDHRRNIYAFLGIIPEGVTDTDIDIDHVGGGCAWIAIIVNATDASLVSVSSDDSDTGTVLVLGTGATGQVGAGDVILVAGEVARGGTTAVWTTTDNTPSNPFGGDWDLRVPGSGDNDLHGSMGYTYLTDQTQQSYDDDVTYGTAREATALLLAISVGGDILATGSGEGTLSATLVEPFQPDTGILRGDGTVLKAYMRGPDALSPLITNTGFEVDASEWEVTGGSIARSTDVARSGSASGLITPVGGQVECRLRTASFLPVQQGIWYRFEAYLYSPNGWLDEGGFKSFFIGIGWYDSGEVILPGGDGFDGGTLAPLPASTWALWTVGPALPPAGAAFAKPFINQAFNPAVGDTWHVDDIQLYQSGLVELGTPFILPGGVD